MIMKRNRKCCNAGLDETNEATVNISSNEPKTVLFTACHNVIRDGVVDPPPQRYKTSHFNTIESFWFSRDLCWRHHGSHCERISFQSATSNFAVIRSSSSSASCCGYIFRLVDNWCCFCRCTAMFAVNLGGKSCHYNLRLNFGFEIGLVPLALTSCQSFHSRGNFEFRSCFLWTSCTTVVH